MNPFATVLFNVCSAVTVECSVAWVCLLSLLLYKEDVFPITERRDMGLYEVPLSVSLLGFGMGTMLANFHNDEWYYVVVKSSFKHAREECESKRAYVF